MAPAQLTAISMLVATTSNADEAWLPGFSFAIASAIAMRTSAGRLVDVCMTKASMLDLNCSIIAPCRMADYSIAPGRGGEIFEALVHIYAPRSAAQFIANLP